MSRPEDPVVRETQAEVPEPKRARSNASSQHGQMPRDEASSRYKELALRRARNMRARGCEIAQPMCKLAASSHGCSKVVPRRACELASSRDETICPQRGELAICELAICELAARRACNVRADNSRTYEFARWHARGEASSPCASSWYARLYTRGEASLQYASSQFARLHARGEASSQYARLPA